MRAVEMVARLEKLNPNYVLYGSSMGAAMNAGALRYALDHDVAVAAVAFVEGVNYSRRPPLQLAGQFIFEGLRHGQAYRDQNPTSIRDCDEPIVPWLKRVFHSPEANARYASALAKGKLRVDMGNLALLAERGIAVLLERGGASTLSRATDHHAMLDELHRVRVPHMQVTYPGHTHGLTMTAESVRRDMARLITV